MTNYHSPSNFNPNQWSSAGEASSQDTAIRVFMTRVFGWMFGALIITAIMAYEFAHIPALIKAVYIYENGYIMGFQPLGWALMFAPLALVLLMSFAFNRLSFFALVGVFILYAAATGASLSTIFFRYDLPTIGGAFAVTAGTFGIMAVMGFITKADLSRFASFLYMGLFGIVIAGVVNWFMHSDTLGYLISIGGVIVFTGLTAWDVQKLKMIGAGQTYGNESAAKLSIMGALTLYLDFINLFLFILRLMGGNRK